MIARPLFLTVLLLVAGAAPAQPVPRLQATFGAGASTPLGSAASTLGPGPARAALAAGLSVRLAPALALDLTQDAAFGDDGGPSTRGATRLALRLVWPGRAAAPYLLAGLSGTASETFAVGGAFGLGVDWPLSRQFDLFQQLAFDVPFGEVAPGSPVNAFGFFSAGLRVRIAPAHRPVRSLTLAAPDTAFVHEPTTLMAIADPTAAHPVTYAWSFDDGQTATGETVTRDFRYPRPYEATVTAENRDGRYTTTRTLVVLPPRPEAEDSTETAAPPVRAEARPAEILQLYGRRTLRAGEVENFRVRLAPGATGPIRYTWDFGDGIAAVGNNVAHWYRAPGTYTVEAVARNEAGGDTARAVITVLPAPERPAAPPDAEPPDGFGWVVATLPNRGAAETRAEALRSAGHTAHTLAHAVPGHAIAYRVVLGRYRSEAEAERARPAAEAFATGPVWLIPFHGGSTP